MIHKVIAVFGCGSKIIRRRTQFGLSGLWDLKLNGRRPHLIQVFGVDFDEDDKRIIYQRLNMAIHPVNGQITVNGQHLESFQWAKS